MMSLAKLARLDRNDPSVILVLTDVVDRLSALPEVSRILLFGSFATGLQNSESDLDIAIICEGASVRLTEFSVRAKGLLRGLGWPVDLVVIPGAIYEVKSLIGGVCFDVRQDGVELYPSWNF